jgi:amino acid adenylation domain-containing protein
MERHGVLRTSFVWEGVEEPLQVVHKEVALPLAVEDWREMSVEQQQERLELLLKTDRYRPFILSEPALMRLTTIRMGECAYYFVMSFHHLLADGWSWPIILKDVFRSYDAYSRGEEVEMDAARPYRDYIAWLREQDLSAAENFWRQNLRGFSAPTPLALDHPAGRAPESEKLFDNQELRLSAKMTASLQGLARKHQLTVNTMMQGAWALLLSHYSREDDVLFGVTVAGRPTALEGAEIMVGLFINTLPLRVRIPRDKKLVAWLKQLQEQQVELSQYEYSPLMDIQGWSEVPRGTALFESILVYEKYPVPVDNSVREESKSLQLHDVRAGEHTHYPITIEVAGSARLLLRAGYDCRRFDAATIGRILIHFQTVLDSMVERPEQLLSEVRVLPEDEKQQVVELWNETATDRFPEQSFSELFEAQAARTPDAIAVSCGGEQLSYLELKRRANRIAVALGEAEVGADTIVALMAERGIEFLTAVLGTFKAGGAYLPLDPLHPATRVAQILEQSRTTLILATRDFAAFLSDALENLSSDGRPRILFIEELLERVQADEDLPGVNAQTDLAYVIYTSGSTGLPKGAMVEHAGMLNHLYAKISALGLSDADIVAQTASQCFDISVWQFLAALLVGGQVVVFRDEIAHDPSRLLREVDAEAVTILETVPSLLVAILDDEGLKANERCELSALRWLVPTGEALPPEVCRQWLNLYPGIPMLNAYGPTECSDDVTHYAISETPAPDVTRIPIGRPIENTRIYILDERLSPVGIGVTGELCVGGVGVGRGYLHDAERTREAFLQDPFATDRKSRLYKTGDLARFLPDGNIEFLGRKDHQVKIRGFRIELGEIEAVLCAHGSVREAIVLAREDEPGDKRLVGYVVPAQEQMVDTGALRNYLKEKLPGYMIPAAFVELAELPLTPNGKVNRRALPAPDNLQPAQEETLTPILNPVEEVLAGIWIEVLRIKQVGIDDNFFELGGQSLLATQVIARIREIFRIEMPLRTLFEAQTIAELATEVEKGISVNGDRPMPSLVPMQRASEVPLSFSQQRLWFINQLEPDNPFYNIARAVRLGGDFDIAALERSLNTIFERHEVLRTTFESSGGRPFQVVHPPAKMALPVVDLSGLPASEKYDLVRRLATEEAQRPFNLERDLMLRVTLLRLEETEHVLLFAMHHIASDGWSMGILLREFTTLYNAYTQGETATLPELPIQYADYALWQREWMQGALLDEQLAYWKQQLGHGSPVLQLPLDKPRPVLQSFRGASELFALPRELAEALRALSRQEGVTLFMTLLAAFQTLLYRYTGQEDISVGTPVAGRGRREVEGLIGFFVNTLVLRTQLNSDPSFRELLKRVREVCLGAYAHQDVPFERLIEEMELERDMSYTPLFQVLFVLQNATKETSQLPQLNVSSIEAETGTSKFDITLMMSDVNQDLVGGFQYNTDLFNASTITRMIEHFKVLLEGMVGNPDRRLSTFPFMTRAEQNQFINAFNDDSEEMESASRDYASI